MRRSFLRWTLPTLLALQLGLLWIQGAQLHRQNLLLQDVHEDLQALLERAGVDAEGAEGDQVAPARFRATTQPLTRVALRRAPALVRQGVSWRRWALGSVILGGGVLIVLARLRRRR